MILEGTKNAHTITYKDPEGVLAPTLVKHLEDFYKQKPKPRDHFGQTSIREFKCMVEEEINGNDVRSYIAIPPIEHGKDYHKKFDNISNLLYTCPPTSFKKELSVPTNTQIKI